MTRDWDAATYHRVSGPQVEFARALLDRLDLRGDETVLDAGCGSGRVTAMLLERLSNGHVETWLEPHPVVPDDPGDYLRTVCLGYHLERLPEELREGYVQAVLERRDPVLDYVRLNVTAGRP